MTIPLQCIACEKTLAPLSGDAPIQPIDALWFTGVASYGSGRDNEHQTIGIDHYAIFVCDDCWATKRKLSVGVKLDTPVRRKKLLFTGEQVEAAFARSKKRRCRVSIRDMFEPESDG